MSSSMVLPKARSGNGTRVSSIQDLSSKGRAILKSAHGGNSDSAGGSRVASNRNVSRGDLFNTTNNVEFEDAIHFHENKHTILSNFEEWIKLSTDNKITSKNSWLIALIDYFKDLNVIKDGDNINFQRASATLDGCVKIYLSRVESVATETGKLLSGLAKKKGEETGDDGGDGGDDDDGGEEGGTGGDLDANGEPGSKKKRKMNRVLESTLVAFDTLRIKKLDQELAIDPLFKKALAEFDEGGAKSLLLNTLNVDTSGRVVFDATTRGGTLGEEETEDEDEDGGNTKKKVLDDFETDTKQLYSNGPINLSSLGALLGDIDEMTICPSLGELKLVLQDINKAKKVLGDVNNKFLDDETNERNAGSESATPYEFPSYDFGDDDDVGGQSMGGGNDELSQQVNESMVKQVLFNASSVGSFGNLRGGIEDSSFEEKAIMDRDLMAYFDDTMKTNWKGPEHWKVANLKTKRINDGIETGVLSAGAGAGTSTVVGATPSAASTKKAKTVIDFFSEEDEEDEDKLFEMPKVLLSTTLKPEQRSSENGNKLPEDIRYNSLRLTNLFLKQQNSVMYKKKANKPETYTDENFFANEYVKREQEEKISSEKDNPFYDDYGGDDDFGGIDFNDALAIPEENAQELDDNTNGSQIKRESTPGSTQLLGGENRKARPEYVTFSRIAKRVDIKLLKDNIWKAIKTESEEVNVETEESQKKEELKFDEIIDSIGQMYAPEVKKDLSTSFCFICLLHLANEHGLSIASNDTNDNLNIKGF